MIKKITKRKIEGSRGGIKSVFCNGFNVCVHIGLCVYNWILSWGKDICIGLKVGLKTLRVHPALTLHDTPTLTACVGCRDGTSPLTCKLTSKRGLLLGESIRTHIQSRLLEWSTSNCQSSGFAINSLKPFSFSVWVNSLFLSSLYTFYIQWHLLIQKRLCY